MVKKDALPAAEPAPVRLTVSLPATDYERVREEAERMRVSLAWVVREAVSTYLGRGQHPHSPSPAAQRGRRMG